MIILYCNDTRSLEELIYYNPVTDKEIVQQVKSGREYENEANIFQNCSDMQIEDIKL